jgi:hypothetical protein
MENVKKPASVIGDPAELFEGRNGKGRFQSGHVANPKGRPRGSRNKLTEAFIGDTFKLWEEQGESILRRAAFQDPMKFADMVARLLPAKIEMKTESPLSDWDHERLVAGLAYVQEQIERGRLAAQTPAMIDVTPKPDADDAA